MLGHVSTCMNLALVYIIFSSQNNLCNNILTFIRSEQLLHERIRTTGNGITSYDYICSKDSIVIHGSQCLVINQQCVRFVVKCVYICGWGGMSFILICVLSFF